MGLRSERKVQMLRNLGIRWQILSALTLPVLILALVAGQATYTSYRDMRQATRRWTCPRRPRPSPAWSPGCPASDC